MPATQDIQRCSGKRAEPGRKGAPSKGQAGGAAEVPLVAQPPAQQQQRRQRPTEKQLSNENNRGGVLLWWNLKIKQRN